MLTHRDYELLDEAACRELLEYGHVGRIALSIGALPTIIPVNYIVDGETIVFRPATGTPLGGALDHVVLGFETGYVDPTGQGGWSVQAVGHAEELLDAPSRLGLELHRLRPWAPSAEDRIFRMSLDLVSGTRIVMEAA
jgi:hypothetical protein